MEESTQLFRNLHFLRHPAAKIDGEDAELAVLLNHLGGLPLGIGQMAIYIGCNKLKIGETLVKYDKITKRILSSDVASSSRHTLLIIWEMQFEKLVGKNAAVILSIMSLIGADAIPICTNVLARRIAEQFLNPGVLSR